MADTGTGNAWRGVMVVATLLLACATPTSAQTPPPESVLPNGSFELGLAGADAPEGWTRDAWVWTSALQWDTSVARDGIASVRITSSTPNDARWVQSVELEPNRNYLLSGWIKTDANPIPNSIYHNTSGFTHDCYSGLTALASDPTHCIGIPAAAWATGGPVTKPYDDWEERPPDSGVTALRALIDRLVARGALRDSWSQPLDAALRALERAQNRGDGAQAAAALRQFARHVERLMTQGRLQASDGRALLAGAHALRLGS